MSNQPKTPHRTVRIAGELWTRTQTKAYAEGRSVSDVIRDALEDYVSEPWDTEPQRRLCVHAHDDDLPMHWLGTGLKCPFVSPTHT